jgi:hypothetical protein
MRVTVESKSVPGNDRHTSYEITGETAAAVQLQIEEFQNAPDTAYATFCNPIREGKQFKSLGIVVSYEKETA